MEQLVLARGVGMSIVGYRCTAALGERPVAELHTRHSVSLVLKGSFGCHCRGRFFELISGCVLIGHAGDEYTCTHDHHNGGDECLSFQLEPALVDELGGDVAAWRCGALPPDPGLIMLVAVAQAAAQGKAGVNSLEAGLLFIGRFMGLAGGPALAEQLSTRMSASGRSRVVNAALWIDAHSRDPIDLQDAAREAGLSAYHFLRLFRRTFGLTPHQYLIRCRLRDAASVLSNEELSITDVAFDVGFGDLSNFVRTFGRAVGMSPTRFRRLAKGDRKILQASMTPAVLR